MLVIVLLFYPYSHVIYGLSIAGVENKSIGKGDLGSRSFSSGIIDGSTNRRSINTTTNSRGDEIGIFRMEGNLGKLTVRYRPRIQRNPRKWTFMVYLDADNNLEDAGIDDFLEMSSVGSTDDVAIVVLFDRTPDYVDYYGDWSETLLFYVDSGVLPYRENAEASFGEANMGNPQTLVDFVSYVVSNYPADHYALVLWDHGGGLSGVCWDDTNGGDNLNLFEIRNALETVCKELGIRIDVVGFDACLMGMMEVAYQLRDYVDYVVFSQEVEPGDGWPYNDILDPLVSNPSMSPSELASMIAQKYIESYNGGSQGSVEWVTQSAINVSYLAFHVFSKINRLVGELLRYYDDYSSAISSAVGDTESFYYSYEKDMIHFLKLLYDDVSNESLKAIINETIYAINGSILYAGHLWYHPNAYGLSAYFPNYYSESYDDILMSLHHQWSEFAKRLGRKYSKLWFYDIDFRGWDRDSDGYYEVAKVYIDLDATSVVEVEVVVYGYDGSTEYKLGEHSTTINGSTSNDAFLVFLKYIPTKSIYVLRFDVMMRNAPSRDLYYYCDDDVVDIPLEEAPWVEIVYPENVSVFNVTSLTIRWEYSNATPLDHFEISLNGSAWLDVGDQTEYVLTDLTESLYVFSVKAWDIYGNIVNSSVVFGIDFTPPMVSIISPLNHTVATSVFVDIVWEGWDNLLIDHYQVKVDDREWVDVGLSQRYTPVLAEGSHVATVRVYDKAGYWSESRIIFVVDISGPQVKIRNPRAGLKVGQVVNVSWLVNDIASGVSRVELYLDDSLKAVFLEGVNMSSWFIISGLSINARHVVKVVAYDNAGFTGSDEIEVDTVPLELSIEEPVGNVIVDRSWFILGWRCSRDTATFQIYVNGTRIAEVVGKNSLNISLGEGVWNVSVVAVDMDGMVLDSKIIVVDILGPYIEILSPQNNTVIESRDLTVRWRVDDISGVKNVSIRIDQEEWINVTGRDTYTFKNLTVGEHVIELEAWDGVNHSSKVVLVVVVREGLSTGYGSAIWLILGVLIVLVSLVVFMIRRKKHRGTRE